MDASTIVMFIRFVVGEEGQHPRRLAGIIRETACLDWYGRLEPYEAKRLEAIYDWFDERLPVPPFSRQAYTHQAVCWLKTEAHEAIRRLWDIAAILNEHGIPVRLLRSANPGKILYEDDYQAVVEQWRQL